MFCLVQNTFAILLRGDTVNTGLFQLLHAVGSASLIAAYLEGSSYDELIELNTRTRTFRSLGHVQKKYNLPLTEGTVEALGANAIDILVHPDEREQITSLIVNGAVSRLLDESPCRGLLCEQFRFRLLSGDWRWVEIVIIRGKEYGLPDDILYLYVFDIQNKKARELGISPEAFTVNANQNEITGLLHKRAFTRIVTQMLKNSAVQWCLVALDIENFKLFNEWYGHSDGDLLMAQIGAKLRQICEEHGGVAGYFGQDDFCMLCPYDIKGIEKLYNDIAALIASRGKAMGFKPAIGVCVTDSQCKVRDMLDRAFLASRYAKESFHSRVRVFDSTMYRRTEEEYHILSDFLLAMESNEVVFYLQPQCRASTGKIVGAEALARWIKPNGDVASPAVFIPVLEKHGLITDLDLFIWESVCRWQHDWIARGNTPLPVSVNVSAIDILNTDLAQTFDTLAERYHIPHDLIKIEITESAYVDNAALVKSAVSGLREKGFVVLMDDFGSGYSTLNMLKNLNVDILKLDAQMLSMDETNEAKSIHILESVATMTKTIGIPIIVEGVESSEQKEFLQDIGCRYIQGYYFYRPMPVDKYEELISSDDIIDTSGIHFKSNQQFRLREILDDTVYSDNMLNNILGPCAFYSRSGDNVDIVRFNEQFYEVVDVPDFHDRLDSIQRFMPRADHPLLLKLLDTAVADHLNGSKGVLHFYKTDGTLTSYFMCFFYLRTEDSRELFYGAVQNITRLTTLERQMQLLSLCSPDTVIFLRRGPDGGTIFSVLFHGLEKQIGISREQLESELNSKDFFERIESEDKYAVVREIFDRINRSESFVVHLQLKDVNGDPLYLTAYSDYILDNTDNIDYIVTLHAASPDH